MDYFGILRMEPTTDLKDIKRAYTRLLKLYPPETNPEEFQRIREAYEKASAYASAELQDDTASSSDPLEQFMKQLRELYESYKSRLDTERWKVLLEAEVCHHMDTQERVSQEILQYLSDHYYLPHEIWLVFNETFEWSRKKEKLYESFHPNFIDYVIGRIERNNFFRYGELLECEAGEQDTFIQHFHSGMHAVDNYEYVEAREAYRKLAVLCPGHPDALILKARYEMVMGSLEEAEGLLTELVRRDSQDYYARYYRAGLHYRLGRYAEAYEDYERILPDRPDAADVLFSLGKCGVILGRYTAAADYLNRLKQILQNDHEVINLLVSAYRYRMEELQAVRESEPGNLEAAHELVTAYLAVNQVEEGYQLLCELEQQAPSAKVYGQMVQALDRLERKELALVTVNKALALYPEDVDLLHWKADLLEELGNVEEALSFYDRAIQQQSGGVAVTYNNKAYALNRLARYGEALAAADEAVRVDPHMPNGYKNRAEALLGLERYSESYESVEEAIRLYPYYLEAFIIKMKLLIAVQQYQQALDTFNRAAQLELKDTRLLVQKALALRYSEDYEGSIEVCEQVLETDVRDVDALLCKAMSHFYLQQYGVAQQAYERVLEVRPLEQARYYLALCFYNQSMPEEALGIAQATLAEGGVEREDLFYDLIGDIYRDRGDHREAALEAYRKAVQRNPMIASYHYQLGVMLDAPETWEEGIRQLDEALELDPTMLRAMEAKLSPLYTHGQQYQTCLQVCDTLLSLDPDHVQAYDFKAWCYYVLEDKEEAGRWVQEGLQRDPNFVSLLHLKMVLLKESGQAREALVVCDRILDLDPEHEDARAKKAELLKDGKKSVFKWFK